MLARRRAALAKTTGLLLFGALSLAAYGCGSSKSNSSSPTPTCASAPSECKPGTTCWIDTSGKYACLPAKKGSGRGATCQNVIGSPQCDEGLGCFPSANGSTTGTCMPFCDNGGCGVGEACAKVSLQNSNAPAIPMCAPASSGNDAGPGNDAGQQDSGSDAATQTDAGSGQDAATSDAGSDGATQSDAAASDAGNG